MSKPSRRRSHSPSDDPKSSSRHHFRRRSPSPRPKARNAHPRPAIPPDLPFQAQPLRKGDLEQYKPMFGLYLDIQKQLVLDELDEKELKGRWKRNRGELAEGWYDPETLRKAQVSAADHPVIPSRSSIPTKTLEDDVTEDEEDEGYGPALPSKSEKHIERARNLRQPGPSIPNIQDLRFQRELNAESSFHDHEALRDARKIDRHLQKERLEEIAPCAAAGTKDRQLERRADLRLANSTFAASKTDSSLAEVPETDLMGDEEGGLAGYKRRKGEEERKRNEREIRRDEILRARKVEREERIQAYKEKEERTMEGLVALAKARFG
ncbi:MAG: hypothetical protein Q9171_000513 [Xanthocarpia ochracea]